MPLPESVFEDLLGHVREWLDARLDKGIADEQNDVIGVDVLDGPPSQPQLIDPLIAEVLRLLYALTSQRQPNVGLEGYPIRRKMPSVTSKVMAVTASTASTRTRLLRLKNMLGIRFQVESLRPLRDGDLARCIGGWIIRQWLPDMRDVTKPARSSARIRQ